MSLSFERHCWAEIDLDALRSNFSVIRRTAGAPVCAVVKADAYGHGAAVVARVLQDEGAAAFAVSCLAEARQLRRHGIERPILVLGYTEPGEAAALAQAKTAATVFSAAYAAALSAAAVAAGVTVDVHLKLDTGMGRLGFSARGGLHSKPETTLNELARCFTLPGLHVTGIFQHFAAADSNAPDDIRYTEYQHARFCKTVDRLRAAGYDPGIVHCSNSAAQMRHPEWRHDMVRAGIILYGLAPSPEVSFPALRPIMTLKSVVAFVKDLHPGESVSYGRTFTAKSELRVATVCVGYADGYPRMLSGTQGQGLMRINGMAAPVVGRVCMDQTVVDVTSIPGVQMGDEVTVFGPGASDTADTIARKTNTINYEIVCGITGRVPRVYTENGRAVQIQSNIEGN